LKKGVVGVVFAACKFMGARRPSKGAFGINGDGGNFSG
jgi:hypothetical protein